MLNVVIICNGLYRYNVLASGYILPYYINYLLIFVLKPRVEETAWQFISWWWIWCRGRRCGRRCGGWCGGWCGGGCGYEGEGGQERHLPSFLFPVPSTSSNAWSQQVGITEAIWKLCKSQCTILTQQLSMKTLLICRFYCMWPSALGVLYIELTPSYPSLLPHFLSLCFFFLLTVFGISYVSVMYRRLCFLSFGFNSVLYIHIQQSTVLKLFHWKWKQFAILWDDARPWA